MLTLISILLLCQDLRTSVTVKELQTELHKTALLYGAENVCKMYRLITIVFDTELMDVYLFNESFIYKYNKFTQCFKFLEEA